MISNNVYHEHEDQTDYVFAKKLPHVNPDCFIVLLCRLSVCFLSHWLKGATLIALKKEDSINDSWNWRRVTDKKETEM